MLRVVNQFEFIIQHNLTIGLFLVTTRKLISKRLFEYLLENVNF